MNLSLGLFACCYEGLTLCGAQASICRDWEAEGQRAGPALLSLELFSLSLTPRVSFLEIYQLQDLDVKKCLGS